MLKQPDLKNIFVPRGDSFDVSFADYQIGEKNEKARTFMNDRRFTVGNTSIAYRLINHWEHCNLLPEGASGGGGWRKFTFVEMVWLRVVAQLRLFGLSLEKIALAKKDVLDWNEELRLYPKFEYYVARAWLSSDNTHVFVLSNGHGGVASAAELEAARMMQGEFDMVLISLKSILEAMGLQTKEASGLFPLTSQETELLATLLTEDNDTVRLKVNADKEITEIETESTILNPPPNHKIQSIVEKEAPFAEVSTKYVNGKRTSVKIIKRSRPEKRMTG